jgi:hypothetical protein
MLYKIESLYIYKGTRLNKNIIFLILFIYKFYICPNKAKVSKLIVKKIILICV